MAKETELKRCADALERIANILEAIFETVAFETKSGGTPKPPPPPPPGGG